MNKNHTSKIILLLKIAAISVFIGRAWQFIFWDAPYRTLLWDQKWMEGIVNTFFSMSWQEYATHPNVDNIINKIIFSTGILYLITALLIPFYQKNRKWIFWIIIFSTTNLLLLFLLYMKERFFHVGQFFEHSAQLSSPVLLTLLIRQKVTVERLKRLINIVVALTFICHGLYAIGFYPRPGVYVDLLINTFGVKESFAHTFILIAGILDIVVAILIFFPKISFYLLGYMMVWGFATAFARVIANVYADFFLQSLHQNIHLFVYRIPHGLLPLIGMILIRPSFLSRKKSI